MINCGAEDHYKHVCPKCKVEFEACRNVPPIKCPNGCDLSIKLPLCPKCGSQDPRFHPAMQHGGEVQLCSDPWHTPTADEIRTSEMNPMEGLCDSEIAGNLDMFLHLIDAERAFIEAEPRVVEIIRRSVKEAADRLQGYDEERADEARNATGQAKDDTAESFEGYLKRRLGDNYSAIVVAALDAIADGTAR